MSIIKDSTKLREALKSRFIDLYSSNSKNGFKAESIIKDAAERDFKITASSLSRYINGDTKTSSLSDNQIVWLAFRYHVPIMLRIGVPTIVDGTLDYIMPKFNEEMALKQLKQVFGK